MVEAGAVARVARRWRWLQWAFFAAVVIGLWGGWRVVAGPAIVLLLVATHQRARRLGWLAAVAHTDPGGWPPPSEEGNV